MQQTQQELVTDLARTQIRQVLRQMGPESINQLLSSTQDGSFDGSDPRADFYAHLAIGAGNSLDSAEDDEAREIVTEFKRLIKGVKILPPGGFDPIERATRGVARGEKAGGNEILAIMKELCEEALDEIGA